MIKLTKPSYSFHIHKDGTMQATCEYPCGHEVSRVFERALSVERMVESLDALHGAFCVQDVAR